jgi:hypothetical protein
MGRGIKEIAAELEAAAKDENRLQIDVVTKRDELQRTELALSEATAVIRHLLDELNEEIGRVRQGAGPQ